MRFLADENFPREAVDILRAADHEIAWGRADAPGSTDLEVLARAQAERRVLVTFDKDFGELAFHARLPADCGIILFRVRKRSAVDIALLVAETIAARKDWAGNFAVVEPDRIRLRRL